MGRPKKERIVERPPLYTSFKPTGRPRKSLQRVELALDQYEAIRLADYEGLGHKEAACTLRAIYLNAGVAGICSKPGSGIHLKCAPTVVLRA